MSLRNKTMAEQQGFIGHSNLNTLTPLYDTTVTRGVFVWVIIRQTMNNSDAENYGKSWFYHYSHTSIKYIPSTPTPYPPMSKTNNKKTRQYLSYNSVIKVQAWGNFTESHKNLKTLQHIKSVVFICEKVFVHWPTMYEAGILPLGYVNISCGGYPMMHLNTF